jgi:DNA-binding CsgD family transcriptional regulator
VRWGSRVELESLALELIGQIYDAVAAPEQWLGFLKSLQAAVGGGAAIALVLELARPGHDGYGATVGHDPAYVASFGEYYWRLEPWLPRLSSADVGDVGHGELLLAHADVLRTEYYNDWLAPQKLSGRIAAAVLRREEGRATATLSILEAAGGRRLEDRDVALLDLLAPHLQRAVRLFRLVGQVNAERRGLRQALDRLPVAVLLLDRRGGVVRTNRRGDELLAGGDGLGAGRDGLLRAASPSVTAGLRKLVGQAVEAAEGRGLTGGGSLPLPRPSGRRPLHGLVTPLRAATLRDAPSETVAALFVTDPERPVELPVDGLRRLYGLTPAEAALAVRLADGASLDQVAEELSLTRNSARVYLKQVFAKTDTHRQGELVALLLKGLLPHDGS